MGTENKTRELKVADSTKAAATGEKLSKLQLVKKQEKKKKITKYVTVAAIVAILAAIIVAVVVSTSANKLGNVVAGESMNYKITNDMVAYYMYEEYGNLVNTYGASTLSSQLGLDTAKSLKTQKPSFMALYYFGYNYNVTWFENFATNAMSRLNEYVTLAEKAGAEGMTLTDDEKASIDSTVKAVKDYARQNGMTVNEYLSRIYINGVTVDTIRKCAEIETLATNYYKKLTDSYEFTDEDMEKYCGDNKGSFYTFDYIYYKYDFELATAENDANYEETNKKKLEEVKAKAETLLGKITDFDSFTKLINEEEKAALEEGSETPAEDKDYFNDFIKKDVPYSEDTDLGKWMNEEGRKEGDTTILGTDNSYSVYMVVTPVHRDETAARNVRHILIQCDPKDETALAEAKTKANEILAEYEAGEKTAEAFGALAAKYSADGNAAQGGLYENVGRGEMVEPFENWLFDETRKDGDTGIVETDYGVHVMYYAGEGEIVWKIAADEGLHNDKYAEDIESFTETYPIAWHTDAISKIDA